VKRSDFFYELPQELIAQTARERGRSRMMVLDPVGESIRHESFETFPDLLGSGDVLVLNDTRVFPARLHAKPKPGMTRSIELLLTRRLGPIAWQCMCRPGRRVRPGDVLEFSDALRARIERKNPDGTIDVEFDAGELDVSTTEHRFWGEVERIGEAPLPPYIHSTERETVLREQYQTVYAAKNGAVAAPTAGLHFSEAILDAIRARGIEIVRVTLHVGAGTFRPVEVDDVEDHEMDPEWYEISESAAAALERARRESRRIVAVGTTSVRTLESAIRVGSGAIEAGSAETRLFITPGFEFRVVDALLTNFHLPESTLLMLVSAFAGTEFVREAYEEAIRERYHFYSFGDCMFVERLKSRDRSDAPSR